MCNSQSAGSFRSDRGNPNFDHSGLHRQLTPHTPSRPPSSRPGTYLVVVLGDQARQPRAQVRLLLWADAAARGGERWGGAGRSGRGLGEAWRAGRGGTKGDASARRRAIGQGLFVFISFTLWSQGGGLGPAGRVHCLIALEGGGAAAAACTAHAHRLISDHPWETARTSTPGPCSASVWAQYRSLGLLPGSRAVRVWRLWSVGLDGHSTQLTWRCQPASSSCGGCCSSGAQMRGSVRYGPPPDCRRFPVTSPMRRRDMGSSPVHVYAPHDGTNPEIDSARSLGNTCSFPPRSRSAFAYRER